MAYLDKLILAVVPARGGSKSIPRKNLCLVGGISLVGRAGNICKDLAWIDRAVLSTDDKEIAEEGIKHGLEVPFMRPVELAGDQVNSKDMWIHAWLESERRFGCKYDISILLEPTSPLRQVADVKKTIQTLIDGKYDAAATISKNPAHFTPHKCLTVNERGQIGFYLQDGAQYSLRQTIPDFYHRNGICYAVKRKTLIENKKLLEDNCAAVIIERPVVNIDDYLELEIAELLFNKEEYK